MGNLYVRVSEISQYLICPRQVYFTSKGYESDIEIDNFLEHLLFRETSRKILEMSFEDIKVIENLTKKIDEIIRHFRNFFYIPNSNDEIISFKHT